MSLDGRMFVRTLFVSATCTVARAQCEEVKSTLQINEWLAREVKEGDAKLKGFAS
jgi:hypothetical protein